MAFGSSLPSRLPQSTGTIRYIESGVGNDSNAGTIGSPWATLGKAFTALANGEKALVKTGTGYSGQIDPTNTNSGTALAPKTLEAYPGHTPVYSGYLRPDGLQYWRIKGLTFNAGFADSFGDTGCYCVSTTAHLEFQDCIIRDNPWGSGMVTETTTSDIQWWGCTIRDNGADSDHFDHGLYIKGSSGVVANCLIYGNQSFGLHLYNGGPVSYIVVNNTIAYNGVRASGLAGWTGGIALGTDSGMNSCHDNVINNNIIAFNTGYAGRSNSNVTSGANNIFRRNLVHGNTLGGGFWEYGGVTESETVSGDPLFTNAGSGDYSLSSGSPAINQAIEAYAPATDKAGAARV